MSTLHRMNTRIADEINRTDLSTQISTAIISAIHHYETERFYMNEDRATSTTVPSQEYYGFPSDFVSCDDLMVTVNGNKYKLMRRSQQYLNEIYVSASSYTGYPVDYSIYDSQFRLYPTPDATYTLEVHYQKTFTELSASASNIWITDAERLIRSRAKWDVYVNLIHDWESADRMKAQETEELFKLRERTGKYGTGSGIRPYI